MFYKLAISSMSLGRAWVHQFPQKLDQAAAYGYGGIEIFWEDLEYLARSYSGGLTDENKLEAARQIKSMCVERNLEIFVLQPFMHYEGLTDPVEHDKRIEKLKLWFKIAKILGTDMIQIPSNFQPTGITGDRDTLIRDLKKVAVMGSKENPPIRFAYENLCWGTYIDTWEAAWDLVSSVDMENFGLCLDTFNIAGRAWADPSSPSGKIENADENLRLSLLNLRKTVDPKKVFFVQVVDAERLRNPLTKDHVWHVEGQLPRMSWSRNSRLFPLEKAGYLPIIDVLEAFCDPVVPNKEGGLPGLGYTGWISLELFSRTMADPSPDVPREHARRGRESFDKLTTVMGWTNTVKRNQAEKAEKIEDRGMKYTKVDGDEDSGILRSFM